MSGRILWDNLVMLPTTTVVDINASQFYPAKNIQETQTIKEFRTTDGTLETELVIDLKTNHPVTDFAIVGNGGTYQFNVTSVILEANPTNEWSSPAFTTSIATMDYYENFTMHNFTEQNYRFWRLRASNTSGFVGFSNIFLGKSILFGTDIKGINFGWRYIRDDSSKFTSGRYNQRFVNVSNSMKKISAKIKLLDVNETAKLQEMSDWLGKTKGFFIMIDETESIVDNKERFAGYFYLDNSLEFTNDFAGYYSCDLKLSEVI